MYRTEQSRHRAACSKDTPRTREDAHLTQSENFFFQRPFHLRGKGALCQNKGQLNDLFQALKEDAGEGGTLRTGPSADLAPHGRDLRRDCGRRRPRWPFCRTGALWIPEYSCASLLCHTATLTMCLRVQG